MELPENDYRQQHQLGVGSGKVDTPKIEGRNQASSVNHARELLIAAHACGALASSVVVNCYCTCSLLL
jgi:hypothetical protein